MLNYFPMDKLLANKKLTELITTFGDNLATYKNTNYNETQLRQEFLNKLIKLLGWDVDNEQGFAETFKEVIHEDKIRVSEQTKAPDYCIQIGGRKLFFIEAKKPSVNIRDDIDPAFQVRRYGWSAKLPLCLLTDFEEYAVYDTTLKPSNKDNSATGRVFYCKYDELFKPYKPNETTTNWDFLYSLFSKEAVQKGSLEKYKKSDKKKGTQEVDEEFLKEIEGWRDVLTGNLTLRNTLTEKELNYIVQKTIDRIIFLRICEDRGIENENTLKNIAEQKDIYKNLLTLFKTADDKYNSGLFHFKNEKDVAQPADTLTTKVNIDDKILKDIIQSLYFPSPYKFSVMSADILGSIYERFLGKVIRLTSEHRAKVEEKPEVRKAGGVYYTPEYIVDYIVQNTVGEQLKDKTPKTLKNFRVLDPACGSGSFLINAYQYLLDWYLSEYVKSPSTYKKQILKTTENTYKLTIQERKRILTEHIYGVDIDSQAVEVTKLSLLLKAIEGINEQELQQSLFNERALPNLSNNIKCGNSLVSNEGSLLGFDMSVNPFDWKINFPEIFAQGGFDVVIGNPPYVKEYTSRETFESVKQSYMAKYYQGKMDLWYVFVCLGIDILKEKGLLSFIAPNNWITNSGASILRNKILAETEIQYYFDFNDYKVFEDASIQTMVFNLQKNIPRKLYTFSYRKVKDKKIEEIKLKNVLLENKKDEVIEQIKIKIQPNIMKDKLIAFVDANTDEVIEKISKAGNYFLTDNNVAQGIVCPQDFVIKSHIAELKNDTIKEKDGIFIINQKELVKFNLLKNERNIIKPYYTTEQLSKYYGNDKNTSWVIYADKEVRENIKNYPNIKAHFDKFKKVITSDFAPYGLHRARKQDFFEGEKIISLRKTVKPYFTYTDFPCYVSQTYFSIKPQDINLKYLAGLLNSKVVYFWLYHKGKKQGEQLQIDKEPLLQIPIVKTDNKEIENAIIKYVDTIIDLKKQSQGISLAREKEQIEDRIKFLENKIDEVVCGLYGVGEEEIKI